MKENRKKLICIVGPTASGKTGLGVELARKLNGEIVSADSRQVFVGLDIGTGKEGRPKVGKMQDTRCNNQTNFKLQIPNSKQYHNATMKQLSNCCRFIDDIPQWLIDICEPEEPFTMFDWLALAKAILDDIWSRGKTPIVVGGTGLYVQALIEGFEVEATKEQKNKRAKEQYQREELERKTKEELAEILKKVDAEAYSKIDLNNPYRMIRAIEKAQSGEVVAKNDPGFDSILIGKDLPREELYSKIDRRVEEWFDEGFSEEVEGLLDSGVSIEWLNKIGLEYKILANFIQIQRSKIENQNEHLEIKKLTENCKLKIENFSSLALVKQSMKYTIHQYARRQLIWWRRFDVTWINSRDEAEKIASDFLFEQKGS